MQFLRQLIHMKLLGNILVKAPILHPTFQEHNAKWRLVSKVENNVCSHHCNEEGKDAWSLQGKARGRRTIVPIIWSLCISTYKKYKSSCSRYVVKSVETPRDLEKVAAILSVNLLPNWNKMH